MKIRREIEKQIEDYKKEGIFLKENDPIEVAFISIDELLNKTIPSQSYVSRKGIKYHLESLKRGRRPAILLSYAWWVIDGHHRREAYFKTNVRKVPIIRHLDPKRKSFAEAINLPHLKTPFQ